MANPFGSSDETLSKNAGHANAANLIRAFIPRANNKWVEVISTTIRTPGATGTYDADGYFFGPNSTIGDFYYPLPASLSAAGTYTVICAARYNSGGASSGDQTAGLTSTTVGELRLRLDRYQRRVYAGHYDSSSVSSGINNSYTNPTANDFSAAVKTTPGSQKAFARVSTTTTTMGTATDSLGGSASLERLYANYATLYGMRYVFLYDAYLSDGDIEAIMDDPGAVISQAGSGGKPASYYAQL